MTEHPYGWWSLAPPLLAILLAIVTRQALLSLLFGIFAGALILAGGSPWAAGGAFLQEHLWANLIDPGRLHIFAFTMLMGAMVAVISRSGGMAGLIELVQPFARDRRRGQIAVWLAGLLVFFDDYANTVLLGTTLRPLTDRLRISREKLAYLIDSTAAPVAGLALVSTWIAIELDFIGQGLANAYGETYSGLGPIDLFVASIPYRFYVIAALVLVGLIAVTMRDFGAMHAAEAAAADDHPPRDGSETLSESEADESLTPSPDSPRRWYNAALPIFVTIGVILWQLVATGFTALAADGKPAESWAAVIGAADSYAALLWGSLAGLLSAVLLAGGQRILDGDQLLAAAKRGAEMMLPALAVLWLAATLSSMCGGTLASEEPRAVPAETAPATDAPSNVANDTLQPFSEQGTKLYTGAWLRTLLSSEDGASRLPLWLLPTLIFVLAAATAFATGTSWGTMGLLMPLTIPLVAGLQPEADAGTPVMLACVGGVLSGAIFGDHCSPISDTTVLSAQASGCDLIAHVWTQMPYALLAAGLSILLGTLPVGLGLPVWACWPMLLAVLAAAVWFWGRPAESSK